MVKQIIFGERGMNKPLQVYTAGTLGVQSIEEIYEGKEKNGRIVEVDDETGEQTGLDCYSYMVLFENGESKSITNTFHVEIEDEEEGQVKDQGLRVEL